MTKSRARKKAAKAPKTCYAGALPQTPGYLKKQKNKAKLDNFT